VTHRGPFQPLPFCDSVIPQHGIMVDERCGLPRAAV